MPLSARNHVCHLLQLPKGQINSKYLGLPLHIPKAKTTTFQPTLEKISSKLASWKSLVLSQAGKSTFIRSVASSITTYAMNTFLLPQSICRKIDSALANFRWGQNSNGNRRIHIGSWDFLCQPGKVGGLGFRRMQGCNPFETRMESYP